MDSFNPLADVMRASIGSLARNLSRTEQEIEAETAAVAMITGQAMAKIIEQREKLRESHEKEQQRAVANGMTQGTPEWKTMIEGQSEAMASFDRVLKRLG